LKLAMLVDTARSIYASLALSSVLLIARSARDAQQLVFEPSLPSSASLNVIFTSLQT
jgi:hypothetical protein